MANEPIPPHHNRRAGANAIAALLDVCPSLTPVEKGDAHHDLVVDEPVDDVGVLVEGVELLEEEQLVEAKSTMVVYGQSQRSGRFTFREAQHQHLLEEGAVYVLIVCEPRPSRDVLAGVVLDASDVDDHLDGEWLDPGDGGPRYRKFAWTRFIDAEEVTGHA